ncbi:MAG: hypothetical protein R2788_02305 [Saprospiraceae bacterium]
MAQRYTAPPVTACSCPEEAGTKRRHNARWQYQPGCNDGNADKRSCERSATASTTTAMALSPRTRWIPTVTSLRVCDNDCNDALTCYQPGRRNLQRPRR